MKPQHQQVRRPAVPLSAATAEYGLVAAIAMDSQFLALHSTGAGLAAPRLLPKSKILTKKFLSRVIDSALKILDDDLDDSTHSVSTRSASTRS